MPGSVLERLGHAAVWVLLLLVPLLVMPSAKDAFRLPKLVASEWLGLASLIGLAWGLGLLLAGLSTTSSGATVATKRECDSENSWAMSERSLSGRLTSAPQP